MKKAAKKQRWALIEGLLDNTGVVVDPWGDVRLDFMSCIETTCF
jgi:hypothetical protein